MWRVASHQQLSHSLLRPRDFIGKNKAFEDGEGSSGFVEQLEAQERRLDTLR